MKQFYNCIAALALTAAALATPSAFGYTAVVGGSNSAASTFLLWVGRANNQADAIDNAQNICRNQRDVRFSGAISFPCDEEDNGYREYFVSSSDNEPPCLAVYTGRHPDGRVYVEKGDNLANARENTRLACARGIIGAERGDNPLFCALFNNIVDEGLVAFTDNVNAVCDPMVGETNGGLICDSHEIANEPDGECEPCTEGTHVIVGDTCTEQETCTGNFVRAPDNLATCMPCGEGLMADSDNTACIPLPEEPEVITEFKLSVQISVTVISVTLNAIRTSENIITVTAGNKEEFAITITNGSMLTITAANGEEILVVGNQGSASDGQDGAINTIVETGDDHEKTAALAAGIGLGIGAIVLGLYYFVNEHDLIVYEPGYSFSGYNDNLSYSLHNRWTATTDNWRFYWQAKQTNDKFVYGSGMRYNNGILSAAMNSESEKDKTALDLQLSANKTVGLWNVGGGVNFDMAISETDTDTQNRLNAKIRYKMDKWILSANANTDGKKAAARINYIYRF